MLGDITWHAIDQAQHACGQAGLLQHLDKAGEGHRRFFRALDDDRAAGSQRGGNLAHGLVDREVPGRERRHRAHRLMLYILAQLGRARRDHAAVAAACLFGKPFQHLAGARELDARLGQALALLMHQHQRHLFGMLAHQRGGLAQIGRALHHRGFAPGGKAGLGGGQRGIQVGAAGLGHAANRAFIGGVGDVQPFLAAAVAPLAVDQQLDLVVHAVLLVLSGFSFARWRGR